MNIIKNLYIQLTRPIQEKWLGTLQAAAVVRSLYLSWGLKKYITIDKTYKILDAGSGEGAPLTLVQARRFKNCDFVAIDLYQTKPSEQKQCIPPNIIFIQNDLFKFSPKNQYDIIICMDVLEHIDNYNKVLEFYHKWIKQEGKLILHVPSTHQVRYLPKDILTHTSRAHRPGDEHVREGFSLMKILEDLGQIGFKIINSRYTFSPFTWFFKELFSIGERKSLPGIGIMMLPFIWLSANAERFLKLERGNGIFIVAKKQ